MTTHLAYNEQSLHPFIGNKFLALRLEIAISGTIAARHERNW